MWYNRLSEYLLKEGFENNPICPCVFIKKSESGFAIVAVYVDDLNLVGTPEELTKTADYLKNEFEMKDLEKVLKHFHMDKAHPLSTPMVVRSLDVKKDPFRPQEVGEETLSPEVPYLNAIGALMYLANCTRPNIAFSINLLARYSSTPTLRHWNGVKHVLRYLRGTTDMRLFYPNKSNPQLVGYADAGYLSDPHKGRSQTGYLFTCGNTAISWRSVKQTISATSSNHSEIIAIHETSRECVWLRSVIQHIREKCGLSSIKDNPTILYEDNAACITQIRGGYIKEKSQITETTRSERLKPLARTAASQRCTATSTHGARHADPRRHHGSIDATTPQSSRGHASSAPHLLACSVAQLVQLRFFLLCKLVVVNLWCVCCACAAA
uniref:Reverse transcriptase Ty1/copia-type domain-containing protein n=1 Tax=Fagus sylvatica TaxID=28930 RepID=A0A2N9ET61_FAGSY